jgi:succinate-semialdehyde dehydrogenase/glutarate-semialdehyde dehydrogenase
VSEARTACYSPNNGRLLDEVETIEPSALEAAVQEAKRAYFALGSDTDSRRQVLTSFRDRLLDDKDALAALVVDEVGKTPAEASGEVDYAAAFVDQALHAMDQGVLDADRIRGHVIRKVGVGPALLIAPYNDPLAGITRKVAPAIAAGCPVLVKPSRLGLLSARALMAHLEAIAPPGTATLVNIADTAAVQRLIGHDEIAIVSFTGSTETGRKVAAAAGAGLTKAVLELGGNNAFLVERDADPEKAADDLIGRKIKAAGQACSSVNRAYVHADIADRFLELLGARTVGLKTGPSTSDVDYGPLRTEGLRDHLSGLHHELGRLDGARSVTAVERSHSGDAIAFPMTWVQLPEVAVNPLDQVETFGPLMTVTVVGETEKALAHIARGRQNLVFYYYGNDAALVRQYFATARHGSIGLNTTAIQGPDIATGGFGEAGFGREGGRYGVAEFLTTLNVADPEGSISLP